MLISWLSSSPQYGAQERGEVGNHVDISRVCHLLPSTSVHLLSLRVLHRAGTMHRRCSTFYRIHVILTLSADSQLQGRFILIPVSLSTTSSTLIRTCYPFTGYPFLRDYTTVLPLQSSSDPLLVFFLLSWRLLSACFTSSSRLLPCFIMASSACFPAASRLPTFSISSYFEAHSVFIMSLCSSSSGSLCLELSSVILPMPQG